MKFLRKLFGLHYHKWFIDYRITEYIFCPVWNYKIIRTCKICGKQKNIYKVKAFPSFEGCYRHLDERLKIFQDQIDIENTESSIKEIESCKNNLIGSKKYIKNNV